MRRCHWQTGVYEYGHFDLESIADEGKTTSLRVQASMKTASAGVGIDEDYLTLIAEGMTG